MSFIIEKTVSREILDSRGNPAIEVDVITQCDTFARASVPSRTSTGSREAIERRDDNRTRFGGKGVLKAIESVNTEINDSLKGNDVRDQRGIDENLANAALIKLNQLGSLSETFDAVQLCHDNNWGTFTSHRSGETVDSFIADMTVAMRAGHLKTGPHAGVSVLKNTISS